MRWMKHRAYTGDNRNACEVLVREPEGKNPIWKRRQVLDNKTLRKLANAPWYISNLTLHNDLSMPYVTEVIRTYAKKHKNRTAQNNNQLIRDLFNQLEIGRRLNRMWPEDLIR
jgi:hypothetical protein